MRLPRAERLEDRAYAVLVEAGGAACLLDLQRRLLRAEPTPAGGRVLGALLKGDPRFRVAGSRVRVVETPAGDPLEGRPLREVPLAVLDFETSGWEVGDRAIEVGVACFEGGREVEGFESLLDPGVPPSPFVVRLTGIRPQDLRGKPPFAAVWPRLAELFRERVVVAHNLPFDMGVLRRELGRLDGGRDFDHLGRFCTLRLARRLVPRGESRSLGALAERFGLRCAARHRALDDARLAGGLLYRLADLAGERSAVETWGDLRRVAEGVAP